MSVDVERLRSHVATLAQRPRPAESAALERARKYVEQQLASAGWIVEHHAFQDVAPDDSRLQGINLVARHRAFDGKRLPRFTVGAHVDSVPHSPGADDNASAVAALLELARLVPERLTSHPRLELELVAFDLEEYGMLGGAEHVRRIRSEDTELRGMVSLEMIGYCDDRPGSQELPRILVGRYPDVGNFIGLIGNQNSERLLAEFRAGMERTPSLPIESLLVPDNGNWLQATRLSDHSPFWDAGYPALMVTDTSFLRNPHYHMASDTPETLDMVFLTRVAQGSLDAVLHIVDVGL
jgi:Zn-dependent M28 family amino/carboxypeptidase